MRKWRTKRKRTEGDKKIKKKSSDKRRIMK